MSLEEFIALVTAIEKGGAVIVAALSLVALIRITAYFMKDRAPGRRRHLKTIRGEDSDSDE